MQAKLKLKTEVGDLDLDDAFVECKQR